MAARSGCSKVFATDLAGCSREDSLARGETPTRLLPTVNIENPFRAIPLSLSLFEKHIRGKGRDIRYGADEERERERNARGNGRAQEKNYLFILHFALYFFSSGIHGDKPPEGRGAGEQ